MSLLLAPPPLPPQSPPLLLLDICRSIPSSSHRVATIEVHRSSSTISGQVVPFRREQGSALFDTAESSRSCASPRFPRVAFQDASSPRRRIFRHLVEQKFRRDLLLYYDRRSCRDVKVWSSSISQFLFLEFLEIIVFSISIRANV